MQFTNAILAALTVFGVSAAPWATTSAPASTSTAGSASCPSSSTEYCCNSGLIGLSCILSSILGSTCTSQSICCVNNGGTQTCTNTDGTSISVPIVINIL